MATPTDGIPCNSVDLACQVLALLEPHHLTTEQAEEVLALVWWSFAHMDHEGMTQ